MSWARKVAFYAYPNLKKLNFWILLLLWAFKSHAQPSRARKLFYNLGPRHSKIAKIENWQFTFLWYLFFSHWKKKWKKKIIKKRGKRYKPRLFSPFQRTRGISTSTQTPLGRLWRSNNVWLTQLRHDALAWQDATRLHWDRDHLSKLS